MQTSRPGLTIAACISMLAATPALAQTAGKAAAAAADSDTGSALPSSDAPIADVVVTANRRAQREREVPGGVTAITGEDLTRREEVRLQDLVGQVPGLSLEEQTPTQVRIVLRGINSGGSGATVGTVIDDVPINAASAQNNGSLVSPNPDTYDLQRVEVLRGPQSSLYGATAEGGLVKYVTNPPDLRIFSGSVEGGPNGLTNGGIGGTMKGYVNVPIVNDKLAIRVSATNEYLPGYINNFENGKSNINSGQQYSWRASLLAQPFENLRIRLFASRQSVFINDNTNVQTIGPGVPAQPAGSNQFNFLSPLQKNARIASASQLETSAYYGEISYDFNFATLTSLTSYGYNKLRLNGDFTNTLIAPGATFSTGLLLPLYGVAGVAGLRQHDDTAKFNQEVRLSSDPGFKIGGFGFDWQGGFYFTHESNVQPQFVDALSPTYPYGVLPGPVLGGSQINAAYTEWATFGQFTWHITPRVSVDLGGRYSGNDQHSELQTFGDVLFGPTSFQPQLNSNAHDALYNFAPKWQIDDDTLTYIRIATGYRPGGPNLPVPGLATIPPLYGPDQTLNYEIGLRRDFFHKTVQVDVDAFYIEWKRIQIISLFQTSAGPIGVIGNAGSAASKGFEWSFNWAPPLVPGLKLGVVGSYTDARLTQNAPGLGGSGGDFLPYVPNVITTLNIDYYWEPVDNYEAYLSASATYIGNRFTSFTSSPFVNNHTLLPSYATGAVRAGVEHGHFGGEIFVNNISDEKGIASYVNNGGANQTGFANLIEPRLIGATLRYGF